MQSIVGNTKLKIYSEEANNIMGSNPFEKAKGEINGAEKSGLISLHTFAEDKTETEFLSSEKETLSVQAMLMSLRNKGVIALPEEFELDGIYGNMTKNAVLQLQQVVNSSLTSENRIVEDGLFGPETENAFKQVFGYEVEEDGEQVVFQNSQDTKNTAERGDNDQQIKSNQNPETESGEPVDIGGLPEGFHTPLDFSDTFKLILNNVNWSQDINVIDSILSREYTVEGKTVENTKALLGLESNKTELDFGEYWVWDERYYRKNKHDFSGINSIEDLLGRLNKYNEHLSKEVSGGLYDKNRNQQNKYVGDKVREVIGGIKGNI